MGERLDPDELPEMGRVRPGLQGHGLALPPLAPLALVAGVVFGLAIGLGIAPKPESAPTPSPEATSTVTPTSPPSVELVTGDLSVDWPAASGLTTTFTFGGLWLDSLPPAGGLSLEEALVKLYAFDPSISSADVVSATIGVSTVGGEEGRTSWAWVFTIARRLRLCPGPVRLSWTGPGDPSAESTAVLVADPSAECVTYASTQVVELDYWTGEYVGGTGP